MTRCPEPPETDADDAARLAAINRKAWRLTIEALRHVTMLPGHSDKWRLRQLVAVDLDRISDGQIAMLNRLAWRYRRQMPKHLVPKLNPDDPIVKEMAHG
jgi:hypothetical protein